MSAKFIKIQKTTLLVLCRGQALFIYNQNQTRQLYKFEITDKAFFTCCCLAYSAETGEEFIAAGTSNGQIYKIEAASSGTSFQKDNVHNLKTGSPITGMAACPKTKIIAIVTGDS